MSSFTRCDICKQEYIPNKCNSNHLGSIVLINKEFHVDEQYNDICPSCTNKIVKFIGIIKVVK
jgi:hypothetical protein